MHLRAFEAMDACTFCGKGQLCNLKYSLQGSVWMQLSSVCYSFNASGNPEAVFTLEKWVSGFMQRMF